jgi:hypothetical protein
VETVECVAVEWIERVETVECVVVECLERVKAVDIVVVEMIERAETVEAVEIEERVEERVDGRGHMIMERGILDREVVMVRVCSTGTRGEMVVAAEVAAI